jgi:hypothetical protein
MLNKRIAQISLSLVTLFNVALPNKSWAESLPVKGSAANASIEDLKTPEIDFDKLNAEFAGKLKELQTQAVKLNDQKIVAPDYKKAQAVFREQLAEGVQFYLNDLALIKKDTEKVLKKSFSRIKALKAASDAAKAGETIDDNALRMTLDAEKRNILDAMKALQENNNVLYSHALLNLRDFKAGGLGARPGAGATPFRSLAPMGLTRITFIRDPEVPQEIRLRDYVLGQGTVSRFNLNPITYCESQLCVNVLMKDITDWQRYVDTLPQNISMEYVLKNIQGQSKVDGTVIIGNTKDKTKTPFIFQSLLDFAKHTFSKPVLTPNTATSLPEAGGKILEKSANMFGGVVAGIAAAPVALFEGTIGGLAVAISEALDIDIAELSLDISNKYTHTNGSYLIKLSRIYGDEYIMTQKLPTILVDNSTQDQDEE